MSDELNQESVEAEEQVELPDSLEYANQGDVPQAKDFATTNKGGYVAEEVDVWVAQILQASIDFLARYNQAAFYYMTVKQSYGELWERQVALEQQNISLQEQNASLEALVSSLQEQNVSVQAQNDELMRLAAISSASTGADEDAEATIQQNVQEALVSQHAQLSAEFNEHYSTLEKSYQDRETAIVAHYQGQLDEAAVVAPASDVAVMSEHQVVSARAQQLLDEASTRARTHVEDTHTTMERLLNEAAEEARETVETAQAEATEMLDHARSEANKAIELKNAAVADREEIFERLKMFYSAQVDSIHEEEASVGYSPLLTLDASLQSSLEDTSGETESVEEEVDEISDEIPEDAFETEKEEASVDEDIEDVEHSASDDEVVVDETIADEVNSDEVDTHQTEALNSYDYPYQAEESVTVEDLESDELVSSYDPAEVEVEVEETVEIESYEPYVSTVVEVAEDDSEPLEVELEVIEDDSEEQ